MAFSISTSISLVLAVQATGGHTVLVSFTVTLVRLVVMAVGLVWPR